MVCLVWFVRALCCVLCCFVLFCVVDFRLLCVGLFWLCVGCGLWCSVMICYVFVLLWFDVGLLSLCFVCLSLVWLHCCEFAFV